MPNCFGIRFEKKFFLNELFLYSTLFELEYLRNISSKNNILKAIVHKNGNVTSEIVSPPMCSKGGLISEGIFNLSNPQKNEQKVKKFRNGIRTNMKIPSEIDPPLLYHHWNSRILL